MFVTLSEYKKRCDAVLKIAQIISKAYDKDRFKNLLIKKIDTEITENILSILNNFRKTQNLNEISKNTLKDIILSDLNWKHLWFDLNELKATMKRHSEYCLKNNYFQLLCAAEDTGGYDGPIPEDKQLDKEKKSNPKDYYGKDRGEIIEDAVQYLDLSSPYSNPIEKNFVCEVCPGPYPIELIPKDFDKKNLWRRKIS